MDDVQLLASEFLERFAKQNGKSVTGFAEDAMRWILSYHWPGNVRELKNTVERGVIMARGNTIQLADLLPRHARMAAEAPSHVTIPVGSSMADAQRQLVVRTFATANGDPERAAKMLGMTADDVRREIRALLDGSGTVVPPALTLENGKADAPSSKAKPTKKK